MLILKFLTNKFKMDERTLSTPILVRAISIQSHKYLRHLHFIRIYFHDYHFWICKNSSIESQRCADSMFGKTILPLHYEADVLAKQSLSLPHIIYARASPYSRQKFSCTNRTTDNVPGEQPDVPYQQTCLLSSLAHPPSDSAVCTCKPTFLRSCPYLCV